MVTVPQNNRPATTSWQRRDGYRRNDAKRQVGGETTAAITTPGVSDKSARQTHNGKLTMAATEAPNSSNTKAQVTSKEETWACAFLYSLLELAETLVALLK